MSDHGSDDESPRLGEGDSKSLSRRQKMSAARLERRRAVDRESQRATRARTKAYIANLEQTISALEKNTNNEQTATLMKQIQQKQAEIDRLNAVVSSVQKLLAPPSMNNAEPSVDEQAVGDSVLASDHFVPSINASILPQIPIPNSTLAEPTPRKGNSMTPFDNSLQCRYGSRNYYGALNTSIEFVQRQARSVTCAALTQSVDDDIAIRAVLHGWEAVEDKYDLDLGWQMVKALDQGLYLRSEPTIRLAHMRLLRDMLIYKSHGQLPNRRQLPAYMTPTETQKTVRHLDLADYFAWPQVRDYLILTKTTVSNERRSAWFATNLRFDWLYELRDVCTKHKETGTYAYSELFDRSFESLSNWSVAPEFFTEASTSPFLSARRIPAIIDGLRLSRQSEPSQVIEWPEGEDVLEEDESRLQPFPPFPTTTPTGSNIKGGPPPHPLSDTYYSRLADWPEVNYITAEFGWTG